MVAKKLMIFPRIGCPNVGVWPREVKLRALPILPIAGVKGHTYKRREGV